MPPPLLADGPVGPEEAAIEAALAALRAGENLAAAGAAVVESAGDRRDLPRFDVEAEDIPAVKLVAEGGYALGWQDNVSHGGRLTLRFELWSPGTNWRDRWRLVTAFRRDLGVGRPGSGGAMIDVLKEYGAPDALVHAELVQGAHRTAARGDDDYATVTEVHLALDFDLIES